MTAGNTSFGSLRSRKVDLKRSLPVLRWSECPDLDETSSLNRAIPAVATGVEKEEEEEHHLQVALNASHAGLSTSSIVIPTPDASRLFEGAERFYTPNFSQPKTLIKFSAQVEDTISCPYCLDEEDEAWLDTFTKQADASIGVEPLSIDGFESIMYTLECLGNDRDFIGGDPVNLAEAIGFIFDNCPNIKLPEQMINAVFEHWRSRRYGSGQPRLVMPTLRTDEIGFRSDTDPYVCFRRREIKPLRKARRGDIASLEKLKRLRDELNRARAILELVLQRENLRKESLLNEKAVFDQRILVRKLKKKYGVTSTEKDIEASPDRKKKRKHDDQRTKIKIPLQKLKEAATFMNDSSDAKDKAGVDGDATISVEMLAKKRKLMDEKMGWVDYTENPVTIPEPKKSNWEEESESQLRSLCAMDPWLGLNAIPSTLYPGRSMYVRTRIGRGGRVCFDRHIRTDRLFLARHRDVIDMKEFESTSNLYSSDSEFDDNLEEFEDDLRNITYRAFKLAPNQEDIYQLMTKPQFSEQINPKPTPDSHRTSFPPPTVSRPPATPSTSNGTPASQTQTLKKGNPVVQKMLVESREEAKKAQLHFMQGARPNGSQTASTATGTQGSPPTSDATNAVNASSPANQASVGNQSALSGGNGAANGVASPKVTPFTNLSINGHMNAQAALNTAAAFQLGLNANMMGGMQMNNGAAGRFPQNIRFPHQLAQQGQIPNPATMQYLYQQQQQRRFGVNGNVVGQAAGMTSNQLVRPHQTPNPLGQMTQAQQAQVMQQLMKKGGQPNQHLPVDQGMLNHMIALSNQPGADQNAAFSVNEENPS
ncbi:Enhancer of polycomb-like protein 1 [Phlyctochytrium planicorne]|nr:Enhancer of polycomb-like protein 1 [Phlyctochytrium planicorne]